MKAARLNPYLGEINYEHCERAPAGANAFFRRFSRFEFALKDTGYVIGDQHRADPHWDGFANAIKANAGEQQFLRRAHQIAPTLMGNPPRKQVLLKKKLNFKNAAPILSVSAVFIAIRCVRNNLFHGGKFGNPDAARDANLIREAQGLLEEALRYHPEVRDAFEGRV